jgi:hypothetical protein
VGSDGPDLVSSDGRDGNRVAIERQEFNLEGFAIAVHEDDHTNVAGFEPMLT